LKEAFDKFEKLNNPKGQSYVLVVLAELAQSTQRYLPTTSSSNLPSSKDYIYWANNLLENGKSDDTFYIAQNFERLSEVAESDKERVQYLQESIKHYSQLPSDFYTDKINELTEKLKGCTR